MSIYRKILATADKDPVLLPDVQAIAEAYKQAVGANGSGLISVADAIKIYELAISGSGLEITVAEGDALAIILEEAKFAPGAKVVLLNKLQSFQGRKALMAASRTPVDKDAAADAIAQNSSLTRFTSPFQWKNPTLYVPSHFLAVAQLVRDGTITVYRGNTFLLLGRGFAGGFYSPETNEMVVDAHVGGIEVPPMLAYLATFAVQDGLKARLQYMTSIADALVAKAMAQSLSGITPQSGEAALAAYNLCVPLVRNGRAMQPDNSEWVEAYETVVEAVLNENLYRSNESLYAYRDDFFKDKTNKENYKAWKNEQATFERIFRALQKP
jgi:hypothetical protein